MSGMVPLTVALALGIVSVLVVVGGALADTVGTTDADPLTVALGLLALAPGRPEALAEAETTAGALDVAAAAVALRNAEALAPAETGRLGEEEALTVALKMGMSKTSSGDEQAGNNPPSSVPATKLPIRFKLRAMRLAS